MEAVESALNSAYNDMDWKWKNVINVVVKIFFHTKIYKIYHQI
jgi:hypothetical protein